MGYYALAPLENLVGVYPSIFARKWRIKLAKILNLTKRIVRQNRSVSLCIIYVRIGLLSVKKLLGTPSRFITSITKQQ